MNDQDLKRIVIIVGTGVIAIKILQHGPLFPMLIVGALGFLAVRKGWFGLGNGNGLVPGTGSGWHWPSPSRPGRTRAPRMFEEWHRRAHEAETPAAPPPVDDQPTVTSSETRMV